MPSWKISVLLVVEEEVKVATICATKTDTVCAREGLKKRNEIKRGKRGLFYGEDAKDFPKALPIPDEEDITTDEEE